jgi:hypothetical protein
VLAATNNVPKRSNKRSVQSLETQLGLCKLRFILSSKHIQSTYRAHTGNNTLKVRAKLWLQPGPPPPSLDATNPLFEGYSA